MKIELTENYFLDKGMLWINGVIDNEVAERTVKGLLYLAEQGFTTITLCANSPGGSVSDGFIIHDTMKLLEKRGVKIKVVCCGLCASMAAFLLASGSKGNRYALPNSEVMIHQPLGGMQGQATDMGIAWNHMQRVKAKYELFLSNYTGKTIEQIQQATDRDNYLSPEEAVDFGIIDGIVENLEDIMEE